MSVKLGLYNRVKVGDALETVMIYNVFPYPPGFDKRFEIYDAKNILLNKDDQRVSVVQVDEPENQNEGDWTTEHIFFRFHMPGMYTIYIRVTNDLSSPRIDKSSYPVKKYIVKVVKNSQSCCWP